MTNGEYVTDPIDASNLNDGTLTATASVSDKAGNPVSAEDSVELDNTAAITTSIDKTADGVINGNGESEAIVVRGTVTDVEDGQTVTVSISDGVNPAVTTTATVNNGEYVTDPIDASNLNDGTLTATASVSDKAGNPVTAEDTVELDNTAAITTSIDKTADGVINGNGESEAIVVRGTVTDIEDGQTVTVSISDGVNPPVEVQATVQNGEYVTDPIDASNLNDGTLTATATASDKAGNPVTAQDSVELDNTAAITTNIDKTADRCINGNGESEAIVVRGTVTDVEDGQTVTVSISDGVNPAVTTTATVTNGEYVTDPIDASNLNDGTLTATASVSDKAGNPVTAQDSVELDNTAAITTSIDKTADGVINGNGESEAIVVRGTVTDIEDGQTVTVSISDGVNPPVEVQATVQNGEYVTDPIDASNLNDGTLTATATASDKAGNPVTAQDSVELDNTAAITTSIDKTADSVINGNGESEAIVVRGTVTDVEDGQTVTVSISDGVNPAVTTTATVTNGEYVTDPIDASNLNDGTLTATASVSDKAGNPVTAQDSVELDNTAAITTSIDKTADGVINGNGESEAIVVRGTVTDIEDGQTVTVSISDGVNPPVEVQATVQNGEYVTDPIDASNLNDGTLTATATASDKAGNPVTAQDSVELDNTAAITTSIDKTADSVINGNGESEAIVVRGTVTDVEDGQTVTVSISDGVNPPVEVQATVQNGEYVTDPIDASNLNDGTLTATASCI